MAADLKTKHGSIYLRLPSADSTETALRALAAAEQLFGAERNQRVSNWDFVWLFGCLVQGESAA